MPEQDCAVMFGFKATRTKTKTNQKCSYSEAVTVAGRTRLVARIMLLGNMPVLKPNIFETQ